MHTFLKLIRYQNLIFIALIQFIMRQAILIPILQKYGFEANQDIAMMILLIVSTVFIAAGGYMLNDFFDVKIDAINRPDNQIVGVLIARNKAMLYYQIATAIGIITGLVLAFLAHSFTLAFIFIVIPGLLWFYSSSYKRQFFIGNLIVAFLSAITILIVGIVELAFLEKEYGSLIFETPIPAQFYGWMGGFALFSFLCTWIREIIKDMEDEKGDREMECRTLPIKWGIGKTKLFLYFLIFFTNIVLYLAYGLFINFEGSLTLSFIMFGLSFPFLILSYLIYSANSPQDYHSASKLSKIIMVIGVLYGFIFYFLLAKTFGISLFNLFIVK